MLIMFGLRRARITETRVRLATEILYRNWHLSDDQQVIALREVGFSEGEAMRLLMLLPTAFIAPQLEERNAILHAEVLARDAEGTWFAAKLDQQPEYVAALRLARRHRREGVLEDRVYSTIAESSAQYDVLRKALEQGTDVAEGVFSTVLVEANVVCYFLGRLRRLPPDVAD